MDVTGCPRPGEYAGLPVLVCCHGWVVSGAQGSEECRECERDNHLPKERT